MLKIIRAVTVPQSLSFVRNAMPKLMEKYEVVLLSSPGEAWQPMEESFPSVKGVKIPMARRIAPISDLKSLFKLVRTMRRERPTMVHSMTPKAGMLCMMAAWITRVPVRVHTFTGLVFPTSTGLKRKLLMATDWITCACATHIIPEGEGVKRDLLDNGITKKPIRVLGYGNVRGIDLERFDRLDEVEAEAKRLRAEGLFTFITIGRLTSEKGIHELVSAFKKLNKEMPATRLLLVGAYEPEIDPLDSSTIDEIDHNPAIEAVGRQSDVRPWLEASDCAILPSYREGFPNVVIEAGAMGLPQIVTDINGSNEIIEEGVNGTIVPSKSVDALYESMKRMATDAQWRESLAANARPMIASRFDKDFVTKCLLDYYDEILKDKE